MESATVSRRVKKLKGPLNQRPEKIQIWMKNCEGARLLAYVTGLVNQELLLQVEYLAAEDRILRAHAPARLRLSNEESSTLAGIGKRLGRKGLAKVALVAKPETILGWFRKLVRSSMAQSIAHTRVGRGLTPKQRR